MSIAQIDTEIQDETVNINLEKNLLATPEREGEFERLIPERIADYQKNNSKQYGNYLLNEDGIFFSPIDKDGTSQPIWISTPIFPIAHLRDRNGKSHTLLLEVHDGERKHTFALPRKIISRWADLNDILLDLNQNTPLLPSLQKHLQTYLQSLQPEKKMRCVDKAGWHNEQYVFPDGQVIGEAHKDDEGIYPINEACPKGIGQKGTLLDWQEKVVSLCVNNTRFIFSLGTAFAALCLSLINAEGGGFNLKGRSSKGKTKCLRVAVSVIGSREYERSWKTTGNGLEGICSLHNDSLLPLDEFGLADASEVGELCYMIAGGIGKQRSGRDGSPREPKSWNVIVLSTGEIGLEDHMLTSKKKARAGQMARVVDIPAEVENGFGCYDDIHKYKDGKEFADAIDRACRENYGTAARAFIEGVVANGVDSARQDLKCGIDDFIANYAANCDGQVKRVAERFGIVFSALVLASKLGVLGNKVSYDMIETSVSSCFNSWLEERGGNEDLETKKLLDQVIGLLQENAESKFANTTESLTEKLRNTIWGYKKGPIVHIFPKAFKENICEGYDIRLATKILIEKGILIPSNDGRSSRVERIPAHYNKTDRFYTINLNFKEENEKT